MSDYTFKKGFAETFGKGMQIGSDAAQKRLEMIAKQKEKESETIDKIRGKSLLADYVRQFDPEGAQMIDALPPEQLAQGLSAIEKRSQFQEAFKKEQQAQAEMGAEQERRGAWGVGGIQPPSESTDSTETQQTVTLTNENQITQTAPASQQAQPSESQSGNGIVRTEASIKTGGVTEKYTNLGAEKAIQQMKDASAVAKEVAAKRGKELDLLQRDFPRVSAVIDTTYDLALAFADEQYKKYGLRPGDFLGIADKMTPKQLNAFKAAWEGAGFEASATVGRYLIPGVRGLSLIEAFSRSTAEIGNNIEGNAYNVSYTKRNLLSTAIANNIVDMTEDGKTVALQDAIIDDVTGKPLSQLPLNQRTQAINRFVDKFTKTQYDYMVGKAYSVNPKLLQNSTITKLQNNAVPFKSEQQLENAITTGKIMPYKFFTINGRLGFYDPKDYVEQQ